MPPWDYIDTLSQTTADSYCDKMHNENDWLLEFVSNKNDATIIDLFDYFNDETGTDKTDCGWRDGSTYTNDGVHPNTLGETYWGEQHWEVSTDSKIYEIYRATITNNNYYDETVDVYCSYDTDYTITTTSSIFSILFIGNKNNPLYATPQGINNVKTFTIDPEYVKSQIYFLNHYKKPDMHIQILLLNNSHLHHNQFDYFVLEQLIN
jgi:hypothetical protein